MRAQPRVTGKASPRSGHRLQRPGRSGRLRTICDRRSGRRPADEDAPAIPSSAPLPVLLLSDGRAGHANLSEGIIAAIARRRPVEVRRLEVRRGRWPGHVLAALTVWRGSARSVLTRVYALEPASLAPATLVVSAGAETLAANVAAARLLGARNIFYGSLRRFRAADFSLSLTSYAADAIAPSQRMVLKPCRLDPDRLPIPAGRRGGMPGRVALLIGGDAPGIAYDAQDWERLAAFLAATHAADGTRWIVSGSRRTPDAVADRLAALARQQPGPVERFIDVRRPDAAGLVEILVDAGAVVATADSSTMLSEAVWARRPALAITPERFRLEARETTYRRHLADRHWARTLPIALLTPATFRAALAQITPYGGNMLDDLSVLLAHQLPELFLSQQ